MWPSDNDCVNSHISLNLIRINMIYSSKSSVYTQLNLDSISDLEVGLQNKYNRT